MATTFSGTATAIDGIWNIGWLGVSPKTTGKLKLATSGDVLTVELESAEGSGSCEGIVEGNRVSWTITLGSSRSPLTFDAAIEGDEIHGTVRMGTIASHTPPAVLEGVRAASGVQLGSRVGSEAVAETLKKCGIEYVFGYSGGATGSLERSFQSPEHGLKSMAGRNELNSAWMSLGYNRVKRRAASAVSVWCVGAMHASPVVYAAKLDSTPLVFMAMEHSTAWDLRDILQDSTELYSALKPFSKYARRLVNVEDVPVAVRQAVLAASSGKPGPAVLCFTYATMHERTTLPSEALVLPSPPAPNEEDVEKTLQMLAEAKRPVLVVGAGVHMSNGAAEFRAFAEATGIPVVSGYSGGRGVLPDDHPLYAGDMGIGAMFYPLGTKVAQDADLWLTIGFSFSQASTQSWSVKKPTKVIQVDIEENQIGRIFQPTLGIVADARVFLSHLNARLKVRGARANSADNPRILEIQKAKEACFQQLASSRGIDPIRPTAMGQVLSDEVPDGTLIVNDEGIKAPGFVFRAAKYPQGIATALPFHYASLGSTLPIAIGAKLADPGRTVISLGGDGGFFYDCSELATLAQNNIKVIVIVNNNSGLYGGRRGRASMGEMASHFGNNPFHYFSDSDFAKVANGFGVEAERVEKYDEFGPAVRRALAADGPYLIDVLSGGSQITGGGSSSAPDMPKKFGHGDPKAEGSWPS